MTDREDSTGYDFNYETGLEKLWGEEALKTVRKMISSAKITQENLRTMAVQMRVSPVFNHHIHRLGVEETFERMRESWYERELFRLSSQEAQESLMRVIEKSRCYPIVVHAVKVCLHVITRQT